MRKGIFRIAALLALSGGASALVPAGAQASPRPRAEAGSACSRLPAGKRVVKLNLKPETDVADLVAWIASITCKQFVLPDVPASHAKVTIVAPSLITSGEAYRLFLDALDSVGLAVYPDGRFLRIIESAKAKGYPIPVVGFGAGGQGG